MSEYVATVQWERGSADFLDDAYSRAHQWVFDGGVTVPASASPHIVPEPRSVANAVDPEEAFVASLSSCHMLWFLSLAQRAGIEVNSYRDHARGIMAKNELGQLAMTEVTLYPEVVCGEQAAAAAALDALHHKAHELCFIANSVKTEVRVKPVSSSLA